MAMTPIETILLVSCCIFVIALLVAEARDSAMLRGAFKIGASLCFVALAIASGASETEFGRTILLALALCAIGDILLIRRHQTWFLAGMAAFAAGHLAFTVAFLQAGAQVGPAALTAFALTTISGVSLLVMMQKDLGALLTPVGVYSAIIAVMCAAAAGLVDLRPEMRHATIAVAALAFAASDISVARDQFQKRALTNRLWGLPLYYSAQLAFALSA